jgi:hypothetical protein
MSWYFDGKSHQVEVSTAITAFTAFKVLILFIVSLSLNLS